ncbi:MAG: FprA family A-type flavoprotein [Eubacteriales bacterium]
MYNVKKITEDLFWVGSEEHRQPLFENIHPVPKGVSYNSYLLLDEKTVLFDTVDWSVCRQFIENIKYVLQGRTLDYLVVNHMEPDHCACIQELILHYPNLIIISSLKAFEYMKQFGFSVEGREEIVGDGSKRSFGKHTFQFVGAPMVHWPEAMVAYDLTEGILFSADAFGSFGGLNGKIFFDELTNSAEYMGEFRRYYTNIVGKFGIQVMNLLKKAGTLDIRMICPLHGYVIRSDFDFFINKYILWSTYQPEIKGVLVVYSSMYGNTEEAAKLTASKLIDAGVEEVVVYDVSGIHMSYLIAESFRYSHVIIAAVTYNLDVYPLIQNYLTDMQMLNLQNRTFGIIENGTWAPIAAKQIRAFITNGMKNMTVLDEQVTIVSALNAKNYEEIECLVARMKEDILMSE